MAYHNFTPGHSVAISPIKKTAPRLVSILMSLLFIAGQSYAQDHNLPADSANAINKLAFNEFHFGFTTARLGIAVMNDWAWYSEDANTRAQMDSAGSKLEDNIAVRDLRFIASGHFNTKRYLAWKIGIMFDGAQREWAFRESGLIVGVPEIHGKIFIGRTKEGYSLAKLQNGYSVPQLERQPSLDPISIMNDGIRYFGEISKPNLFWSLGAFSNVLYGDDSKFMLYKWAYTGKFGWLPLYRKEANEIVHLAVNYRVAKPINDKINVRSRPESNPAPYFVETGTFQSDLVSTVGYEAYYFKGPLMVGSEGNYYSYSSAQAGDPHFYGANVIFTYNLTGESYPYMKDLAVSSFVEPRKSVFSGGYGALQFLFTASMYNTNDGLKPGGNYWRITPMLNWYMSSSFAIKLAYGYGMLDRFNLTGYTQFYQIRLQYAII